MTCRHSPGDPSCTSRLGRISSLEEQLVAERGPSTPDADRYQIEAFERYGAHVVLKVKYPNCVKCAYEGSKVMVFLHASEAALVGWRRIDPHFRDGTTVCGPEEARSPAARFPASAEGWKDACNYARSKSAIGCTCGKG